MIKIVKRHAEFFKNFSACLFLKFLNRKLVVFTRYGFVVVVVRQRLAFAK